MVVSHTNLTEVTRVIFVEVNPVVMLTTGVTTTTFVLSVFADTTVTVRNLPAELSAFLKSLNHLDAERWWWISREKVVVGLNGGTR